MTQGCDVAGGATASLIVPTRNRPDHLIRCLESLEADAPRLAEIVIVDNSSDDSTSRRLERFPARAPLRLVRRPDVRDNQPLLRNAGMAAASGDLFLSLDDDCVVEPGWLEGLLRPFADPSVGIVGGRITEDPAYVHPTETAVGYLRSDGRVVGNFGRDPGGPIDVSLVVTGNMAVRRSVVEAIGGYDPTLCGTSVYEEPDFCFRALAAGFRVVFTPESRAAHRPAPKTQMADRHGWTGFYYHQRNQAYFILRHGARHGVPPWRWLVRDCLRQMRKGGRGLWDPWPKASGLLQWATFRPARLRRGLEARRP